MLRRKASSQRQNSVIAVIFALQNLAAVTVSFFIWSLHGSLALVLLVTLATGVLISLLVSLPGLIRGKWITSSQKKSCHGFLNGLNGF